MERNPSQVGTSKMYRPWTPLPADGAQSAGLTVTGVMAACIFRLWHSFAWPLLTDSQPLYMTEWKTTATSQNGKEATGKHMSPSSTGGLEMVTGWLFWELCLEYSSCVRTKPCIIGKVMSAVHHGDSQGCRLCSKSWVQSLSALCH